MEPLEDRQLLASFLVNTPADNGNNINPTPGSFRAALIGANSNPGSVILFKLNPNNNTIKVSSPLPTVTADFTEILAGGVVDVDGFIAGNCDGLTIAANNCIISGISVDEFQGAGLRIHGSWNMVVDCFIGTDEHGNSGLGNGGDGVLLDPAAGSSPSHNTFKGDYVAGNDGNGIALVGAGTTNNLITKSFIGLASAKTDDDAKPTLVPMGNHLNGVSIYGYANNNTVGGTGLFLNGKGGLGTGNIISANYGSGVSLFGIGTTMNVVASNLIGTNEYGTGVIPNGNAGVEITAGASNNQIGGFHISTGPTGLGNLISGNGGAGVGIHGYWTSGNLVEGNTIGTDFKGTSALGNDAGVVIDQGASNNIVGFAKTGMFKSLGNLISGNRHAGVALSGNWTTGNLVEANLIGTNLLGTGAVANLEGGVTIWDAGGNTIGGTDHSEIGFSPGNLISGNTTDGVLLAGNATTQNLIAGNKIGTDFTGVSAVPNTRNGVEVVGAAGNIIGGLDPAAGNLISGNTTNGVMITSISNANVIQHNLIGTNFKGSGAVGNGQDGVDLYGSGNTLSDNLISGNGDAGVRIGGSMNVVADNKIGTDIQGAVAVPNHHDGVFISVLNGPGGNTVGGSAAGAGNLISGNGWNGIEITGTASAGNLIQGNRIGTDGTGLKLVSNFRDGILVSSTTGYRIGGENSGEGNLISGNLWNGVEITGSGSTMLPVMGNLIGTNVNGTLAVPNFLNGVYIANGATKNVIGGVRSGAGNLISGNGNDGIQIFGEVTNNNVVLGNRVGTDVNGTSALANHWNGVEINQGQKNSVGGSARGAGNLISGNFLDGVKILVAKANLVAGNLIGTDVSGTQPLANGGHGVDLLQGANFNTIGGAVATSDSPGNVISGNLGSGVMIVDRGTQWNLVQGNYIGTTRNGHFALGNKQDGVSIVTGATTNLIGGAGGVGPGGTGNLISGNAGEGVRISGSPTTQNVVAGNWIGTDVTSQQALGNAQHGVLVDLGAQNNTIGGQTADVGNVIAYNAKAGVAVGIVIMDASTLHNSILSNSIFDNGGLGIDLGNDGVTQNTPGVHVGPNQLQNTPVIQSAAPAAFTTAVHLSLNGLASSTFTVQIFASPTADPTAYGEGKTLVYSGTVATDATGNVSFVVTLPKNFTGQYLSATATAPLGDTSEFGRAFKVGASIIGQALTGGGPTLSQMVNSGRAPATFIALPGPELDSDRVDAVLASGAGLVQGPAQRRADAILQTVRVR